MYQLHIIFRCDIITSAL